MPTAFLLLNCELGTEQKIIQKLYEIESIKEVKGTFGSYDIITKIETATAQELKNIVTEKIGNFENITGTITLMGIDGQE